MKKLLIYILAVCFLSGCSSNANQQNNSNRNQQSNPNENQQATNSSDYLEEKIRIVVDGKEVIITLYDNDLSRQLLSQLPLDCDFTDYGNCEKAANVQDLIEINNESLGYEPKPGDVVVYEPWGNFTVFYDEFRYSDALAIIGTVESGLEVLSQIDGNFQGRVELVDE